MGVRRTCSFSLPVGWIHVSAGVSVLMIGIVLLATIAASALLGNTVARRKEV